MSRRRLGLFNKPGGGGFSFNNALQFDGVNDYCSFTKKGTVEDTWSYSGWFYSSNVATTNNGIMSNDISVTYIRANQASTRLIVRINGTNVFFTGFTWVNNTWYHIAISTNALSCRVWVNDVESTAGTLTIPSIGSNLNFELLGTDDAGTPTNGKIDEWGLWYGSYLTDADVTTLYNSGNGSDVSAINSGTLWVGSHHDESTGNTTANLGSSGTITLNNFPVDDSQWVTH